MPDAQLTVRSLECRIAADHSLSCTVNADALVLLRRSHTPHCITDFLSAGRPAEDPGGQCQSVQQPGAAAVFCRIRRKHPDRGAYPSCDLCGCGMLRRAAEKGLQISASMQVLCLDDEQRLCSVQRVLPLTFTGIEAGTCPRPSLSVRAQPVGGARTDADRYSGRESASARHR